MTDSINYFARFAQLGYTRLVPVIPPTADISKGSSLHKRLGTKQDGRGKTPGIKGRNGDWFSFDWVPYEADSTDYHRWNSMAAGVGIKTGQGIIAIDADTLDERYARIIKDTIEEVIGQTPIRIGNYPKALYVVRSIGPVQYQRIDFGPNIALPGDAPNFERVEILSDGRFFVAQGIHPKTGKPYEWVRPPIDVTELPALTPQQVTQLLETLRQRLPEASKVQKEGGTSEVSQASLKGDPAKIRKAVAAIPNTSALFPSRESYRDMGYAIKAAVENDAEAYEIFADWCDRWVEGENDPDVIAADWARMKPPYRRGAQWIYELAEEHGSRADFSIGEVWFENLEDPDNPFLEIFLNEEKSAPKRKFDFLDFQDVVAQGLTTNPPLIKGLLDQGAMSVLYGDSNTGKTFVAMDIAFHIGAGLSYAGLRTTPGLVVYIAAEGGNGAKKRLVALRERYAGASPAFKLLPSPVDLRKADADLVPLTDALRDLGAPVALLVVDTLSRAMAGGDENSSVDMGALVRNFDGLRSAIAPAHLMVVHHTGKDKAKGARGHSLLRAATDTEIEVVAEGVVTVTKQRDMDKSWSSGFKLRVHRLGVDGDGDPITSCTVDLVGVEEARAEAAVPTAKEREVLVALEGLADEREGGAISTRDVAARLTDNPSKKDVETTRSHLRNLETKRLVLKDTGGKWLKKAVEDASTTPCFPGLGPEKAVESGRDLISGIFD